MKKFLTLLKICMRKRVFWSWDVVLTLPLVWKEPWKLKNWLICTVKEYRYKYKFVIVMIPPSSITFFFKFFLLGWRIETWTFGLSRFHYTHHFDHYEGWCSRKMYECCTTSYRTWRPSHFDCWKRWYGDHDVLQKGHWSASHCWRFTRNSDRNPNAIVIVPFGSS